MTLLTERPPMPSAHGAKRAAARLRVPLDEYLAQREAGNLWCSDHKAWEPFTSSQGNASRRGGYMGICQQAQNDRSSAWVGANRDSWNTYMRNYMRSRRAQQIHGRGTPTATRLAAHDRAQRESIAWG